MPNPITTLYPLFAGNSPLGTSLFQDAYVHEAQQITGPFPSV
jgi:hypothetical protein